MRRDCLYTVWTGRSLATRVDEPTTRPSSGLVSELQLRRDRNGMLCGCVVNTESHSVMRGLEISLFGLHDSAGLAPPSMTSTCQFV